LSAILWLLFCIWELVVVVMFVIVLGFISTICFVAFVVFAFGFGAVIVIMVGNNAFIVGGFVDVWGVMIEFVVVVVGGECRLFVILWLTCCSH